MAKKYPPKWHEVYPQGTQFGNDEFKFFVALTRNPKFSWRSIASIQNVSGLSREKVEKLIQKYHNKGMIFQSPKNEDLWGYWENVPEMLSEVEESLASKDQKSRINKHLKVDGDAKSKQANKKQLSANDDDDDDGP